MCLAWNNHFVCSHSHFPLLIKGLSTRLVAHIGQVPTTAQPKRDARPDLHFITPPAPENHLLDSVCITLMWSPARWDSTAQLWAAHCRKLKLFIFSTLKKQKMLSALIGISCTTMKWVTPNGTCSSAARSAQLLRVCLLQFNGCTSASTLGFSASPAPSTQLLKHHLQKSDRILYYLTGFSDK